MANWFRITANNYVAKNGSDSNTGAAPEQGAGTIGAKATIQAGIIATTASLPTCAFGAGFYKEAIAVSLGSSGVRNFYAAGKVVLRATGSNNFTLSGSTNGVVFHNIEFQGYTFNGDRAHTFNSCTFKNCVFNITLSVVNFNDCEFQSCSGNSAFMRFTRCRIVNASTFAVAATILTNTVVGSTSKVTVSDATTGSNNCIFGTIRHSSTGAMGAYLTWENFVASHATPALAGSFNADPLWTDSNLGLYTVQKSSPLIGRGDNGGNIGSVSIAIYHPIVYVPGGAVSTNPFSANNPNVIHEGLVLNPDSVSVDSNPALPTGGLYGRRTSDWIALDSGRLTRILGYDPIGNLEFNKSINPPDIENMNVPDSTPGQNTSDGSNTPDRLTYEMMFSNSITKPSNNAQGDNAGLWPAGTFRHFEYGQPAYVHIAPGTGIVKTYGEVDFPHTDNANISIISARWVKVRERFSNDYKN